MTSLRQLTGLADAALLVLGLAGFVLFFSLLSSQHPDAAADYSLGPEGAANQAADFLRSNGYEAANLDAQVEFRREGAFLDSLQKKVTRPVAVALLRQDSVAARPAYFWEVGWTRGSANDDEDARVFTVSLDTEGRVRAFRKQASARAIVNRRLLAGLGSLDSLGNAPRLPEAVSDSLLRAALSFAVGDSLWARRPSAGMPATEADSIQQSLGVSRASGASVTVGPSWAVAVARAHLNQSGLNGIPLEADSVWLPARGDGTTANIRFVGHDAVLDRPFEVTTEVHVTGALLALETRFTPERQGPPFQGRPPGPPPREDGEPSIRADITLDDTLGIVSVLMYLALFVGLLFVFLRRLHARAIDAKVALRDALWGGFFLAGQVTLSAGYDIVSSVPNLWFGIFLAGVAMAVSGAAGALIIFVVSNAADSISRDIWPDKLASLTLMRLGVLRNIPIGLAFLRGLLLGGVLLGVVVAALYLFPQIALDLSNDPFIHHDALSPIGYLFGSHAYMGLFIMLVVLLGVGTLIYQRWPMPYVVIPCLILVLVAGRTTLADVTPAWGSLVLAGGIGTAIAAAFWRYDALTCFLGYLIAGLFWGLAPAWLIAPTPLPADVVTLLGLTGIALVIGLAGTFSGRSEAELPSYVPSYVQELAREERLKGELEIAHVVQASFLPKRMPKLEGVDLAAMCLPAQEVGGDYYDFVELGGGRLALVIGDVSGKGIQAAFYMTLVKGFFITLSSTVNSPAEILRRINTMFCENAPKGMFISLICGILDTQARTFTFARAGHNPIIVKRAPSYEPEFMQPPGLAIGLIRGPKFDAAIEEVTLHLCSADVLVFYTDGFTEAMNARRQQYGDSRLAQKVGGAGHRSAAEILRTVSEDVHHFLEAVGRQDDMTMVVIKMETHLTHTSDISGHKSVAFTAPDVDTF